MRLQQSRHLLSCALLGASLLLSACGFQLRGTGVDSFHINELQVSALDSHSQTQPLLLDALRNNGVTVRNSAPYHLQLLGEPVYRRALNSSGRASSAEYNLQQQLVYQITDAAGRPLIGPETLSTQRAYVSDRDNLVGSSEEEALLRREMRQELTRQLILRLSHINADDLAERERALGQPVD